MSKNWIIIFLLSLCFSILLQCSSSDNLAGGSTDIEVNGVTQSKGGDDIGNAIISLLPDSFSSIETIDIPEEFLDTTNAAGEFKFIISNPGLYTLYILDTVNHESYYEKSISIDSSINLGTVVNKQTANLLINIPLQFQKDSGYCIIPGTQRRITFTPSQQTALFSDVPSGVEFPIILYSFDNSISSKKSTINSITAGETDTLSGGIRVLYFIDTSTIKEPYPVDLADSINVEGVIDVSIKKIQNFQGTDTANYDIIYIASNVDFLENAKWFPLMQTSKTVICASAESHRFIDLTSNTEGLDFGTDSVNAINKIVSGWNSFFPDSTISINESINLFSADTAQKYPVEWGLPSANGKIALQGNKPFLFYYPKGVLMAEDIAANGIRIGMFGCNVQQFNSEVIQMIRNTIIRFGK